MFGMPANIKNISQLDSSPLRHTALNILQAALNSIDTESVIRKSVALDGNTLRIRDASYDLSNFKRIRVIGFGKAAARAASALEQLLGNHITDGAIISLEDAHCKLIKTYKGTHPLPSQENVEATEYIIKIAESSDEHDLIIVIVSGGGSALLCWPEPEYMQGKRLYEAFLKSGGTINQLNTVRKHISEIKGGGLAKMLHPATVVGLIFSDVPGDHDDVVASGPTFFDATTAVDAERIARELGLGTYEFIETPKDAQLFASVRNITLVSNTVALDAMSAAAQEAGFVPVLLTSELYDPAQQAIEKLFASARPRSAIIAGGEVSVKTHHNGSGGRNLHMSLLALQRITENQLFVALASDGMDNSDAAGAIADSATAASAQKAGLDPKPYIERTDAYTFFQKINNPALEEHLTRLEHSPMLFRGGDNMLITGPTGANVSDLYLLLTK